MAEEKPIILVVDDEPVAIKMVSLQLRDLYQVVPASNGEEALAAIEQQPPDLVILDVVMPGLDGFEVCRRLKYERQTQFIPIIMVTALSDVEHRVKGIEAGADDFINKPFNQLELLARIRSLLRIKQLNQQLEAKIAELESTKQELEQLAITDELTGLYNYRYFKNQLQTELAYAKRTKSNLSVAVIDIDHFKNYNDRNGHLQGNRILVVIADLLKKHSRNTDVAARFGGEELALVLANCDSAAADTVARKLKKIVEDYRFDFQESQPQGSLTVSIGVASFPRDGLDPDDLVGVADARLYRAKQQGRNLVVSE